MGNEHSTPLYSRLDNALPGWVEGYGFKDSKDREQFIYAVATVVSSNGTLDLKDHDFKLLYSRREDKQDAVVARIVAMKDGVITTKLESSGSGKDQKEAFKNLRTYVELQLEKILQRVPNAETADFTASSSTNSQSNRPSDAPPAYSRGSAQVPAGKKN